MMIWSGFPSGKLPRSPYAMTREQRFRLYAVVSGTVFIATTVVALLLNLLFG